MNVIKKIQNSLIDIINNINLGSLLVSKPEDISIDLSKTPEHGDISTNIAMILAKKLKKNPNYIAKEIKQKLEELEIIDKVDIAGPGFLNMYISLQAWHDQLIEILQLKNNWGKSNIGELKSVNIEYVSANPTGPLHVGHVRGAVLGDSIANILNFVGYKVTKEYYINDAGVQIKNLSKSLYSRYNELFGININIDLENYYPGDYLVQIAKKIKNLDNNKWLELSEDHWMDYFRNFSISEIMNIIKDDLNLLNIKHDIFFFESDLHRNFKIEKVFGKLNDLNLIYEGTIPPPKNSKFKNNEPEKQLLFRSKKFGDDIDRPLKKSDGSFTYFAADMAYHYDKLERGYDQIINIWGADHSGYIKRMKSAVNALSENKLNLDVKVCNLVKLTKDGKPFKMSKRSGNFVTLNELVQEVGPDVIRFMMLTQKPETTVDFDLKKAVEMSSENPVFYVQYAHARIFSLFRKVKEENIDIDLDLNFNNDELSPLLNNLGELNLIKKISIWPNIVLLAASRNEPHKIVYYLQELANLFHSHWNEGAKNIEIRFIKKDDKVLTRSRLLMCNAVSQVIANGLKLIGVEPLKEMR